MEACEGRSSWTDVVPGVASSAEKTIEDIEADGNPDVDSGIECSGGKMQHNEGYEANK